jgi:diguanylate cyclase (GGDEF)-like protein
MHISDIEIAHRMEILELSKDDLDLLSECLPIIEKNIEEIVQKFYTKQIEIDEISLLIGDSETLKRLRSAQRNYVIELFSGFYDGEYVNSRLRIGLVHKRIGVEPKLFLAATLTLKNILFKVLEAEIKKEEILIKCQKTLDKLLNFDVALVFDTYIDTIVSEVNSAKRRMEAYARGLEEKTRQLEAHADRDPLTGLLNKRGMQKSLKREMRIAQRRRSYLSLIYFDVNNFKEINDTQGHAVGDDVLKHFAVCMTQNCRETDLACRLGGDEFCIILPDCERRGAAIVADKITDQIKSHEPAYSVSIGISETGPEEFLDELHFVKSADHSMYQNKARKKEACNGNSATESILMPDTQKP